MNVPERHPLAKAEIERYARWYDEQKPGLGYEFLDEVQRILKNIAEQPLRYSKRFGSWHRANLRRFPFAVYYQIFDSVPVIFAVLHSKRDHPPILEQRAPEI